MEEKAKGRMKEAAGAVTGDEGLRAEGRVLLGRTGRRETYRVMAQPERGWVVESGEAGQITSVRRTKDEAVSMARELARAHEPSQVLIYKQGGTAQAIGKEPGVTDEQQARRVDEAAERFAWSLVEAYRAVAGRSLAAQELNAQLTRSFFDRVIGNLRTQIEENQGLADSLTEQQRRQQEAAQTLAGESVAAYMDLLGSVFAPPRQGARTARHTAREDGPGPNLATGGEEGAVREAALSHPLGTWVEPSREAADAPAGVERASREQPSPGEERPERWGEIPTSPPTPREEPPPGEERPGRRRQ